MEIPEQEAFVEEDSEGNSEDYIYVGEGDLNEILEESEVQEARAPISKLGEPSKIREFPEDTTLQRAVGSQAAHLPREDLLVQPLGREAALGHPEILRLRRCTSTPSSLGQDVHAVDV